MELGNKPRSGVQTRNRAGAMTPPSAIGGTRVLQSACQPWFRDAKARGRLITLSKKDAIHNQAVVHSASANSKPQLRSRSIVRVSSHSRAIVRAASAHSEGVLL